MLFLKEIAHTRRWLYPLGHLELKRKRAVFGRGKVVVGKISRDLCDIFLIYD